MKLTRSTAHLILAPDLAALVLCAMRLGLRETNGRRMGVLKSTDITEQIWERSGRVQESEGSICRAEVRESQ